MSANHSGNVQPSIDNEEHRSVNGVNSKAVAPYSYDGSNLVPIPTAFFKNAYDDMQFSNADANGNYQTLTLKSGGGTVNTFAITYDGSSNITRFQRTV